MPHSPHRALILGFALFAAGSAVAATSIQSFSPATNDRFANDPAFIGAGHDFSGVGRDSSGHWATMLSPTVFISANHYQPSGLLYFYPGNDPSATPVVSAIATAERIGVTDFYIGRLAAPLPGSITSYDFVTVALTEAGFGSSPLAGAGVFMGGVSPTTTGYGSNVPDVTDQTVGTNRIEGFFADLTAAGSVTDAVVTVRNQPGDSAYGYTMTTYEAQLAAGDSGSPLFIVSGGNLVLAGVALAVSSSPADIDPGAGTAPRDLSAFSYTGSYAEEIQTYIDGGVIPEPAAAVLAGLSLAGLCLRRPQRSR